VNADRKFGIVVGGLFALLGGLLFFWRHRTGWGVALGVPGTVLVLLGIAAPQLLSGPHRAWLAFAKVLGRINAFVFLSIVFFLILTPLGLVLRLFGRDELRRRGAAPPSMWTPYPERNGDPRHFERIF
jgi:hypothetical protein